MVLMKSEEISKAVSLLSIPKGVSPGIVATYGGCDYSRAYYSDSGVYDNDTLFDLASITKMFLCVLYLILQERDYVNINQTIGYYSNRFPYIGSLTVKDLLSYNVHLKTEKRIDACDSYSEACNVLFEIKGAYSVVQEYSDMPPIVLGILLQDIMGKDFGSLIEELIIKPCKLTHTKWKANDIGVKNCASYDGEMWLGEDGIIYKNNPIGIANDPKARVLSENGKYLSGHAGLFSSMSDIIVFSQAILQGKVLPFEYLKKITDGNGRAYCSKRNSYGFLCYRKYNDPIQSEVPHLLSDYAFAASGFTGCYLVIDPIKSLFAFIGGNRLNNCISKNLSETKEKNGCFEIDGKCYRSSIKYVYERDSLRDMLVSAALL